MVEFVLAHPFVTLAAFVGVIQLGNALLFTLRVIVRGYPPEV